MLGIGFSAFIRGNKALMQQMMRARVAAQSATVIAMAVSSGVVLTKQKQEPDAEPVAGR